MAKPTGGWLAWTHHEMVEYLVSGDDLKIRFRCRDIHRGWTIKLTDTIDTTIRRHLQDMSRGNVDIQHAGLRTRAVQVPKVVQHKSLQN